MIETLKTFFNKLLGRQTDSDSKNNKGMIEFNLGRFESALIYFTEALKTAESLKDIKGKASSLNNIGLVYQGWGKPEQALEYYQKALEIDEELKDIRGKATRLNNIGLVYQDWGKPEQALEYYQKALEIDEELKDISGKETRLNNIGLVYQDWGKPEQALEYYQKALEIDEEPKEKNGNEAILLRDRRWEIVQDLLKITKEENKAKKTRIMQRANLDWRNFQRYFGFLLEEGLIENCDSNCYELTKRGEELIRRLGQVDEILNRKV